MVKIKKIFSSDLGLAIFFFILAAILRLVPEIKAGLWPIGYDTFNTYAAELASYQGPLINWIKTANILYFFFLPFKALGASPNLIMKICGPLFYGGLAVSFYYFVRRFLNYSFLKSFLVVFLIIFQLACLRISWDLFRNELSLIFLFWGLIYLPDLHQTKNLILFSLFASLVVLSNQLVTVLLIIILICYLVWNLIRHQGEKTISLLIPLIMMGILFTIVINSSGQVLYDPHVIFTSEKNYFWRYFYRYNELMSYQVLKENIISLFWLLYAWLLPPAIIGFWYLKKNLVLVSMTLWLVFGTFSALIFLGNGLMVWERWMFMLVFPLTIYAVEGIFQLGRWISKLRWSYQFSKISLTLGLFFWLIYFSFFIFGRALPFITADYRQAKPPLANDELNSYFPRTMVHNCIGIWFIPEIIDVVNWLDDKAPAGSVILVDNRYRGVMLANFNIDDRYIITNSWSENIPKESLEAAKKAQFWPIYLIWNITRGIDGFDRIYSSGSRAIYQALPEFKK